MPRKAQFAMEYILIIGFSILLLLPIVYFLYAEYDKVRVDVNVEHLSDVAREIVFQAEKIYYQGPPSQITIQAYFPSGIESITIEEIGERQGFIIFELADTDATIETVSKVPIKGELRTFSGIHKIRLWAEEEAGRTIVLITDED